MAREIHVDGQTLYFVLGPSDPIGRIERDRPRIPEEIRAWRDRRGSVVIDVAQVQPFGKMVGERSISIIEDIDRNREVARRLAAAWNLTRYLPIETLEARASLVSTMLEMGDFEADAIETDLAFTLPRSRVHSLLHRLQVVLS